MSEPLGANQGSVFFQIRPTDAPEYLGCIDVGDIPAPTGEITQFYCRNRDGVIETIGTTQAPPAQGTTTLTLPIFADADIIDEIKNCNFTVYIMTDNCGKLGVFNSYVRGVILHNVRVSNRTLQNLAMRESSDKSMRVLDVSYGSVFNLRQLTVVRQTIAETRDLNAITFDMDTRCAGDCGAPKDPNDIGYIGSDGSAGSPTTDADVWSTDDEGSTWANATGAVPSPFTGGSIMSAVLYQMDRNTWRLLVASSVKAGSAQVAYSDDGGATWTTVTCGATAWEGATHADALFALDRDHIWFCTSAGNVYFSSDGGATFTAQASALTASASTTLNCVKFSDADNGFAVGNNDTIIQTNDGGDNWTAITTSPTTSDNITALQVFSKYMLMIGSNADGLFKSLDGGVTWTTISFSGQGTTGTVNGLDFVNDEVGFMIHNTSAPVGSVHFTANGGVTWQKLTTPTNTGLNDVIAIDENTAYAVGNAQGGTGFVCKISG